jgi:small subunit ribosomal protein S21
MSKRRSVNVVVKSKYDGEPIERMIRRFNKKVKKEKIIEDFRENRYYEKPSERKKREARRKKKVLEKLRLKRENTLNKY